MNQLKSYSQQEVIEVNVPRFVSRKEKSVIALYIPIRRSTLSRVAFSICANSVIFP